jgi:hypothetical protein
MRTAFIWVITQPEVVILSGVSGQPIGPIIKNPDSLEDATDTLSRNVGKESPLLAA